MGLMYCSRKGCDNIMCSNYIIREGYGYICYDCKNEYESILEFKKPTSIKKAYKLLDKMLDSEKVIVKDSDIIKIEDIINEN